MPLFNQPEIVEKGQTAVAVFVFFGLSFFILGWSSAGAFPLAGPMSSATQGGLPYVLETAEAATAQSEVRDVQTDRSEAKGVQEAPSEDQETLVTTLRKLEQLVGASQAAAKKQRDQLEAATRENERLGSVLADAWQKLSALERDKRDAQDRIAQLTNATEQSRADIAGLSQELAISQQRIESLERASSEAAAQLAETEKELEGARNETVQLRQELASTRMELETSNTALTEAQDANDEARSKLDSIRAQLLELVGPRDAQAQSDDAPATEQPETPKPIKDKSSEGAHRSTGTTFALNKP